jgi:hypothetical protein
VRMADSPRNTLVYLTYSDRVIGFAGRHEALLPVRRAPTLLASCHFTGLTTAGVAYVCCAWEREPGVDDEAGPPRAIEKPRRDPKVRPTPCR